MSDWKTSLQKEFDMAAAARARGNEGQARVCARRAAGIALRQYFQQRGLPVRSASAYDLLKDFMDLTDSPADARQSAEYLTLRVTAEFKLPVAVDLLEEARTLCKHLLPDSLD